MKAVNFKCSGHHYTWKPTRQANTYYRRSILDANVIMAQSNPFRHEVASMRDHFQPLRLIYIAADVTWSKL